MLELFTKYSMLEIVSFLVILAGATKGFFSFMDWAIDRLRKIFKKEALYGGCLLLLILFLTRKIIYYCLL